jgi:hypothetical protein
MSAGDGIPRVEKELDKLVGKLDAGILKLQNWISLADLAEERVKNEDRGPGGTPSGLRPLAASEGLNPLSGSVLDEEGYAEGSYHATNKAAAAYDAKIAQDMEAFGKELDQAYGMQTAIGAGFQKLADYIRAGRFSGQVAEQYAQALFFNFAAGAAHDLVDPTKSNQVKALVSEFLRFLSSGQLIG